jgi:hypothetical protein
VLALGAAVQVLWPRPVASRAVPLGLPQGDQEIVWLYAATNAAAWQRLVTAASNAARRLAVEAPELGLHVDEEHAFPQQTTAVPELVFSFHRTPSRLHLRWYKLTSGLKTRDWVEALAGRTPPPLAIIGGSSSDLAIELAQALRDVSPRLGAGSPLLLLTTATAGEVEDPAGVRVPFNAIYPGRTFRFCFTNGQMARAVIDFLWSQPDLRPDADPVYLAMWEDDPYSVDLSDRFCEALRLPAARAVAHDWAWSAGFSMAGGLPLDFPSLRSSRFRLALPALPERIPYSVGSFSQPNRWEEEAVRGLLEKRGQHPEQRRPLLLLTASTQPARRFLRGLERAAPAEARRFVIATGDALAFNVFYRDRNLAWPIQDMPFPFVFFCHRNPVDAVAGFRPENGARATDPNEGSPATGTEDLLLYGDLVETLAQAAGREGAPPVKQNDPLPLPGSADQLGQVLRQASFRADGHVSLVPGGRTLFDDLGNRRSGTGEHVVCLRPDVRGDRILSRATIAVWSWRPEGRPGSRWHLSRDPLPVEYDEAAE